ncbi:hypothetical protein PISMIDRAFT_90649 [Pisolithus microcarpus 441]|uniref:Uncharacterized protein n=1 Tax=Pisolithus microcarpus 441 TaxID=765257 RepID=A0A0D0A2T7_9AGAM|nr:hypothetical protein PISMIDRAFT_90649 [Pisolithus microcarpus 441]
MELELDDLLHHEQGSDPLPADIEAASTNVEVYPGAAMSYVSGLTFMDKFFADKYGELCKENIFYPFTSREDWQIASWLLHSHLSMAAIDSFLSLELVGYISHIKRLMLSFQTARELHLHAEMLLPGPRWQSRVLQPQNLTKRVAMLFYCDPIKCLQSLLSHPLFKPHISFVPRKVWSTAAQISRVYDKWLTGDHAWELQNQLPHGGTFLGVMLSSDKTNISVMSRNCMAHPLLLSLANISMDICSKGSLHGHMLLALLPVLSFIHKKSCVRSLLSDRLFHRCLDLVLKPLKIAATVGVMMNDPCGNVRYCFTPLVGYIADTPEQSLLACMSPRVSPMSTATHREFGDNMCHPPRTGT